MNEKKDIAWLQTKAHQIAHYLWTDKKGNADITAKRVVDAGSSVAIFDNFYTNYRLDGGIEYNREIIVMIDGRELCRKIGDYVFEADLKGEKKEDHEA